MQDIDGERGLADIGRLRRRDEFKKGLLDAFGNGSRGAGEVAQQVVRVVRCRLPFCLNLLPDDGQHCLGVPVKQGSEPIGIGFLGMTGMAGGEGGLLGCEA